MLTLRIESVCETRAQTVSGIGGEDLVDNGIVELMEETAIDKSSVEEAKSYGIVVDEIHGATRSFDPWASESVCEEPRMCHEQMLRNGEKNSDYTNADVSHRG